ncbi:isopentenyl phosphate kinase [Candidatus Poseidoniales archaeon]|nr:isopentenyl phosphate kinase [Candidatus Poseidoniales archaeon]MDC3317480.1 isopentenyl phosphate kinase [Candidatus Poseidoniaceae archaeon]
MGRRIVVKFGGALITKKDEQSVAHLQIIRKLCSIIKEITEEGIQVIIVHGAGSFGHLKAKRWRLNEGYLPDFELIDDTCSSQREAVDDVRKDMLTLNAIVLSELKQAGLNALSHPPHEWASNLGPQFDGDLVRFKSDDVRTVNVTFGDVVDVDGESKFGILSGDDLVARLSIELPDVESLVFAMGGVDGLLKVPPHLATDDDLIEYWSPDVSYEGLHQTDIDVTGGIGLKIQRGHLVAKNGISVHLINGEYPERILNLVRNQPWKGTTILG